MASPKSVSNRDRSEAGSLLVDIVISMESLEREDKILVVGCGVIGLFVAKLLREKLGVKVLVYSDSQPLDTTSAGAGGHWEPFHCEPADLVDEWAEKSLVRYLFLY